ncbi:MAG: Hsp20/alpha crystallin family protein [Rhodospirillales bacterium]
MDIRDLMPWNWPRGAQGEPAGGDVPLKALQTDINRAFESFWRSFSVPTVHANWGMSIEHGGLPIDLVETNGEIEVSAEMPGLEEGDIEIAISDDLLTIKAEKRARHDRQGPGYRINERCYGMIHRTVVLPAPVDPDRVTASFRNGVLTVIVPKVPASTQDVRYIVVNKG